VYDRDFVMHFRHALRWKSRLLCVHLHVRNAVLKGRLESCHRVLWDMQAHATECAIIMLIDAMWLDSLYVKHTTLPGVAVCLKTQLITPPQSSCLDGTQRYVIHQRRAYKLLAIVLLISDQSRARQVHAIVGCKMPVATTWRSLPR
jgi:hypothetical protein